MLNNGMSSEQEFFVLLACVVGAGALVYATGSFWLAVPFALVAWLALRRWN